MKKLILIIGLALPWTAFADVTFYDQWGNVTGHANQNRAGNWEFSDPWGRTTGSAQGSYNGNWTFYDRWGNAVGSQDGQ